MRKFPELVVYSFAPLDWWAGMIRLDRFDAGQFADDYADDDFAPDNTPDGFKRYIGQMLDEAGELARAIGWEGDMRQGPFLSALPSPIDNSTIPILAWKQDNNGLTFIAVARPVEMYERACDDSAFYVDGKIVTERPMEPLV